MGKTKNSINDSLKYLKLINLAKGKSEDGEQCELTFNSGNTLKLVEIDSEFASEIVNCLKIQPENRIKQHWLKDKTLYLRYETRFDAVYSMQLILENYGDLLKDQISQLSVADSELVY